MERCDQRGTASLLVHCGLMPAVLACASPPTERQWLPSAACTLIGCDVPERASDVKPDPNSNETQHINLLKQHNDLIAFPTPFCLVWLQWFDVAGGRRETVPFQKKQSFPYTRAVKPHLPLPSRKPGVCLDKGDHSPCPLHSTWSIFPSAHRGYCSPHTAT